MMRKLKIFICAIVGAFCGALLMYLLLPAICDYFVGPIYGEDQMSVNASIFFIGTPVMFIIGAIVGWFWVGSTSSIPGAIVLSKADFFVPFSHFLHVPVPAKIHSLHSLFFRVIG